MQAAERALKHLTELRKSSNKAFFPLFFDEHEFLVLMGGAGSGKSIFAGRKILERCLTEPGHRWLVCRKVGKTLRNSCFDQLRGQLAEHYGGVKAKVNKSDMRIELPNGSVILFAGLDDVEKLTAMGSGKFADELDIPQSDEEEEYYAELEEEEEDG